MRSVAIIGAGQAGLCLAHVLKRLNYNVSLFSNRTSEQIRNGRILSTQVLFDKTLQLERKWGFNKWDDVCNWGQSQTFSAQVPGERKEAIHWKANYPRPYQSIDQRIKFSYLLDEFEKTNGKLYIKDVGLNELNQIAKDNDLSIVAGGKGEISQCFPRDTKNSLFDKPMRALACMYLNGVTPDESNSGIRVNSIPEIGEYFIMPSYSLTGACDACVFEGIPGGPFDCFKDVKDPEEQLKISVELLKEYIPWEAERYQNIRLVDSQATLIGRFPPTVREPVAIMPCGKPVLGVADTVVLNDPLSAQGANNAVKCADIYIKSIVERGDKPFDEEWMRGTFKRFWESSGKYSTMLSNIFLLPPQPHVLVFLAFGQKNKKGAERILGGLEDPSSLFPWILNEEETRYMMEQLEKEVKSQKLSTVQSVC